MGAYLFSDCKVGALSSIHDLNTLKHISTTGDELSFELNEARDDLVNYVLEFFKYLYQKSPFTLKVQIIKAKFDFEVAGGNDKCYSMLLSLEQYLNKYIICKKFNQQKPNSKPSYNGICSNIHNLVKIDFKDIIYRIKTITLHDSNNKILNYFGLMCLKGDYDNNTIKNFYLNKEHNDEYDHLVSCNFILESINIFIDYFPKFILKHKVSNIKFPPLLLKDIKKETTTSIGIREIEIDNNKVNNNTNLNDCDYNYITKLFEAIESNKDLHFIDLSFVIYIDSIQDIYTELKYIIVNLPKKRCKEFDYIIRFYLFSRFNLFSKLSECKLYFKKALLNCEDKSNSIIIMNIFKEGITKCDISPINPRISDEKIQTILDNKEDEYHKLQQTNEWHYRNREEFHSEKKYALLHLSQSLYRVYSNTQLQVMFFIYLVFSNNKKMKKFRPKTILSSITKFLSIDLTVEECKPKKLRFIVFKKHYDNQIENVIPIVKFPRNSEQLNQDLVHCHYDHIYNLLNNTSNSLSK